MSNNSALRLRFGNAIGRPNIQNYRPKTAVRYNRPDYSDLLRITTNAIAAAAALEKNETKNNDDVKKKKVFEKPPPPRSRVTEIDIVSILHRNSYSSARNLAKTLNRIIRRVNASLSLLNIQSHSDISMSSDQIRTAAMAHCPLQLLNPPNMSHRGWSILNEIAPEFGYWIRNSPDGYLFFSRIFTAIYVHTRGDDWIPLNILNTLFYFHFGTSIDYGNLPLKSPFQLIRALAYFIDSWHSPMNTIRIRLHLNRHAHDDRPFVFCSDRLSRPDLIRHRFAFKETYTDGDEFDTFAGNIKIPKLRRTVNMAPFDQSDEWRIERCRKELYLTLLIHFPDEGIEHSELKQLLIGHVKDHFKQHFSNVMWSIEFIESTVLEGDTWIDDIIDITEIMNNNRIYRCRFDHPDIAISKELAETIGKAAYVHELIRDDFNMIADKEKVRFAAVMLNDDPINETTIVGEVKVDVPVATSIRHHRVVPMKIKSILRH